MLHSNNVACEILKCYCLKISNDKEGWKRLITKELD
jgi:hypothetical protein